MCQAARVGDRRCGGDRRAHWRLGAVATALVLGLVAATAARAATITVPCTGAGGGPNGLISAIVSADQNQASAPWTISLTSGCTYDFTSAYLGSDTVTGPGSEGTVGLEDWYGPSALPAIATAVTIEGNGAILHATQPASPNANPPAGSFNPDFRFFFVGADPGNSSTSGYASPGAGSLTLEDLTLAGGVAQGGNGSQAGGGAGMGGAIFNQGSLTLAAVTITGSAARGGTGYIHFGDAGGGMGENGSNFSGGGFGPGAFGGAAGGSGSAGAAGGGGGFALADVGGAASGSTSGAGGGPATGLGGAGAAGGAGGGSGDGSGGGGSTPAAGGGDGGGFGAGAGALGDGGGGVGGGGVYGGGGGFGGGGGVLGGGGGFGGGGGGDALNPGFGGGDGGRESSGAFDGGGGAGMGGAIINMQGSVAITNSTLYGNAATGAAALAGSSATGGQGLGGAIFNLNGSVSLTAVTVDGNTAADGGGGVFNLAYDSATGRTASVSLSDGILSGDTGGDLESDWPVDTTVGANLGSAPVAATKPNIVRASSSVGANASISGTAITSDPLLQAPANNGGPGMQTQLPGAGSPALGAGTSCLAADERGVARPATGCDLGAAEVTAPAVPPTITEQFGATSIPVGGSTSLMFTVANPNGGSQLTGVGFTDSLPSGLVVSTPNGLSGSCGGGSISATAGSGSVSLSGARLAASAGCSFSVDVTGTSAGVKNNTTGPVGSDQTGPGGTASAAITVAATAAQSPGVPVNTTVPAITGTAEAGAVLSCSEGSWTNHPTSFGYRWSRDGTPLAGATGSTYTVKKLDEGTTLTCAVTAVDPAGSSAPARSAGLQIRVPEVAGCPAASGSLSGDRLGLVRLGMTRARARQAYTHSSTRGRRYQDFFCLTPIGVRVGYASPKLLAELPHNQAHRLAGRTVWISTSNPRYAIEGIRAGATLNAAEQALPGGNLFRIGRNTWYLAHTKHATAVLKIRDGNIQEVGLADTELTRTRPVERQLMTSFQ
jgi:hypothetical protein